MITPKPDYEGGCISNVIAATSLALAKNRGGYDWPTSDSLEETIAGSNSTYSFDCSSWLPRSTVESNQVVILVVDGLGALQLDEHLGHLPNISKLRGGVIDSVAPTTTATALTSIATGKVPINHGLIGYRINISDNHIMNTLTWRCDGLDAEWGPEPSSIALSRSFFDLEVAVISKIVFKDTYFSRAYLGERNFRFFRTISSMVGEIKTSLAGGSPLVYSYYEGVDNVAHEFGLGDHYFMELEFLDFYVGEIIKVLPKGASLLVTADHGQVEILDKPIRMDDFILDRTTRMSGEGRFRWLHCDDSQVVAIYDCASELYGDVGWVVTKEEALEGGLFGQGEMKNRDVVASRLGDVAVIARSEVAFYDPLETGPMELICRHGSLTDAELKVPLIGYLAD